MKYFNPRKECTIDNWPYGRHRTTATFLVDSSKRGERAMRMTVNPTTGQTNKPKTTTYAKKVLIVDGPDDKTYILELSEFGHISVMQSNLQYQEEVIHSDSPIYAETLALFNHDLS